MTTPNSEPPRQDKPRSEDRREFLKRSGAAAAAGFLGLLPAGALGKEGRRRPENAARGPRADAGKPNFLVLLVDQMRYPAEYESLDLWTFRQQYLATENALRAAGVEFHRHYAASAGGPPSRASLCTGHYPSLHGVSSTPCGAKDPRDPGVFWLSPGTVPTMGDYFRAAGYRTFWKGNWQVSDADISVPGTSRPLASFDSKGAPDPAREAQYLAADRLNTLGFSGWIGPEPRGKDLLYSGSSALGARGRDSSFARQAVDLIGDLERAKDDDPWLLVVSLVNPGDIGLYGLWANLPAHMVLPVDPAVPHQLFNPDLFARSQGDDLRRKPRCQRTFQKAYAAHMGAIPDRGSYLRFYYQLHREVDSEMGKVYQRLKESRFFEDTIVVFTSGHGDLLGAHGDLHRGWYSAYEEATRVPLIISNPRIAPQPRAVQTLTSHVDLLPTMLSLAGLDPEGLRQDLAPTHAEAQSLVGRNLAPLVRGAAAEGAYQDPVFFMTDDDPSRGLNRDNFHGIPHRSVSQPGHVESVIARLQDGTLWKFSRYSDNPQFWSAPGDPGKPGVEDVVVRPMAEPDRARAVQEIPFRRVSKGSPRRAQYEMYFLDADPMEIQNLAGDPAHAAQEASLRDLLEVERAVKRLSPRSGTVPGQP